MSRGGDKLEAALDAFGIDPRLQRVIDVGASTGGFTDCLLQRGAARVAAVDVGSNQVHERLRADQRVQCLERTDVRRLDPAVVGGPAPLVVADVSFISLRLIVAELCRLSSSDVVVLVKPQFEAGKTEADRGRGVIRDPEVWRKALRDVIAAFEGADGALRGVLASPLLGARGNVEFFVYVSVSRLESCGAGDADAAVERAVAAGLALRARAAARPGTIAERA